MFLVDVVHIVVAFLVLLLDVNDQHRINAARHLMLVKLLKQHIRIRAKAYVILRVSVTSTAVK